MGTQNSQKRSPRSSVKSKQNTTAPSESSSAKSFEEYEDVERYMDRSGDHVARVRAAKEAAQRAMESFGDVSEYDVSIIQGQLREEAAAAPQSSLDFPTEPGETH